MHKIVGWEVDSLTTTVQKRAVKICEKVNCRHNRGQTFSVGSSSFPEQQEDKQDKKREK